MSIVRRILGPPAPKPIGIVRWGDNRAELWGRNVWTVYRRGTRDDKFARSLVDAYSDRPHGPGDGYYGPAVLSDLAGRMGGSYTFNAPRERGGRVIN